MSDKQDWSIVTETGAFEQWQEIDDSSATPVKKLGNKTLDEIIKEAEEANRRNL